MFDVHFNEKNTTIESAVKWSENDDDDVDDWNDDEDYYDDEIDKWNDDDDDREKRA